MRTSEFFKDLIIEDEDKPRAEKALWSKGIEKHILIKEYLQAWSYNSLRYSQVATTYRYDKRIRNVLYKYISYLEEFYRAKILDNCFNKESELSSFIPIKKLLDAGLSLNESLEALEFKHLIGLVKSISNNFEEDCIYVAEHLNRNFYSLRILRNAVMHERLFVSIAYRIEGDGNGRNIVMETGTTKLVVFFPMDGMETFLHFKVNGPYATTNTRDNLSIEPKNKKDNELILNETISLYEDSLRCIKDLGLFNISFLSKLPINSGLLFQNDHSKAFYESTLKLLKEETFLPTANGGFAKPSESLLVGSKELVELLSEDDTASVFDGKCKWLDISITPTNKATQDIYRYINSTLGVSDIDANAFIRRVRDKFLASNMAGLMITQDSTHILYVHCKRLSGFIMNVVKLFTRVKFIYQIF